MAENDDNETLEIATTIENAVRTRPLTPERCLADASLALSIDDPTREAMFSDQILTAVVKVPDSDWAKAVQRALDRTFGAEWHFINRGEKRRKSTSTESDAVEAAESLAKGKSVALIASSGVLSDDYVKSADLSIDVQGGTVEVLAHAITRYLDAGPIDQSMLPDATALSLPQICLAFRPTANAGEIAARLNKMLAASAPTFGEDVPLLQDAPEFGAFRNWGLGVVENYEDFRAGRNGMTWRQIESSVIIFGAPGHGKTTAVNAFAKSLGAATFISTSIADLFSSGSGFLDSCIKASIEIFSRAESAVAAGAVPVVILVDEIDALPSRIGLDSRSLSWWGSLISQWLILCQKPRENVFLCACTNHLDRVDPALRRPGRFGRCIEMTGADATGIVSITRRHLRGALADVDLSAFASLMTGRTAAEIMQTVKIGASLAHNEKRDMEIADLITAALPSPELSATERRMIAIHEAGHVIAALAVDGDHVVSAAIGGGADALGFTTFKRTSEIATLETREKSIMVTLGGRAAEMIEFGTGSANASDDLAQATSMIASSLLTDGLGPSLIHFGTTESVQAMLRNDPIVRAQIDRTLNDLMQRSTAVLERYRTALHAVAGELEARLFISGDRARELFDEHCPQTEEPPNA